LQLCRRVGGDRKSSRCLLFRMSVGPL